jgi:hypothetical protein
MAAIVTTIEIGRGAEEVFAYATDPTRFSEWQQGVTGGRMEADGTPTVGTRCHTTRRIGGAERASVSEVTHVDAPKTWGVRGIDGPIRALADLTVQPLAADRSQLTISVDFTRPRHRQTSRSTDRAPRSRQGDAHQRGHAETTARETALSRRPVRPILCAPSPSARRLVGEAAWWTRAPTAHT